ncbi:hypothetical protein GobsT_38520 [Gemmata obscuriglobus]|uniref:DUF1501 domain-containing protein n=1 Tax=Gemmata obscuriglobus TaxID=114 RepID=A0A2Z3GWE4_9BACT|nr:DUF1501 domain-containing protein [Gemmata obscuriglobus]AWM38063.1 DUF1501 domain-containing protein [Gemmata obscuriglobus]QEG29063.1 hypothetical protein GobsT_38520 [Gemmata obscuriglobus]VTS07701.1 sulfatase : Uncharacterized protein OS=Singulisphaera acidiphila (strain ATCC BAA-1392 / DSM 18658 / VKM B-2454 / MOB10) GN=Sinac_6967 PE=4 SV=1: DUF1501 [Gemmata obscuriglobus UQM 2246]
MHPRTERLLHQTRRNFLHTSSLGLGALALSSLLNDGRAEGPKVENPLAPKDPHFAASAKRVIYLHMSGAPPHLDLFDYKPALQKHDGQECPDEYLKGKRFAFTSGVPKLLGTRQPFKQHGKSGIWMSDAIKPLHAVADDVTVIRSMKTDEFNHAPAELLLYTGFARQGRPSLGAWTCYGLGSESANLPGFVVLISSGVQPSGGQGCWGSGFLPSVFQGVQCRSKGEPVLYLSDPPGLDRDMRRLGLDAMKDLNELQEAELGHPETRTRISQYELAFRMQLSASEVMDISKESQKVLDAYGAKPGAGSFANNCLLARRLVEQGVRYVQLFDWGWDFHGTNPNEDIRDGLTKKGTVTAQAVAALISDLKSRDLLKDTLVVWGGEFGRTPFREGRTAGGKVLGRDHYPDAFSLMLAGGGIKAGHTHGESDELGFKVVRDEVHIHDLQATLMHCLGFDHTRLTYRFQGRDYRLTDVHGNVVKGVLA